MSNCRRLLSLRLRIWRWVNNGKGSLWIKEISIYLSRLVERMEEDKSDSQLV